MSEYIITCDEEVAMWVGNDVETMKRIVRCRDCKHYNTKLTDEYDGTSWCCIHAGYAFPDDYCSWAERRERESAEVWNQWSADDVTCSEES